MSGIVGTSHSKSKVIGRSKGTAKAWISWHSDGSTHADYGCAAMTDTATGKWYINFDSALTDADYAIVLHAERQNQQGENISFVTSTSTASTARIYNRYDDGTFVDSPHCDALIFR